MAHLKQRSKPSSLPYEPLSKATIVLHWLVAIGIFGMLIFGLRLWLMPSGPAKNALIPLHKSLGIIVGLLAMARVGVRLYEGFPRPISKSDPAYEKFAAHFVQTILLVLTLILPLSGIAKSISYARGVSIFEFQIIPQLLVEKNEAWHRAASIVHTSTAIVLIVFVVAHMCAAVWHHIGRRDETLSRMFFDRQAE